MYSNHSVQIKYRRKIYENVASLAYRRPSEEQFKRLPESLVAQMGSQEYQGEFSSDLDYAAEACCAALNLEPRSYKEVISSDIMGALNEVENDTQGGHSNLCALKSVCRKCVQTMGSTRHCAVVCPTGAITVDNMGSTTIDQNKCISCGKCMLACPYGAIIDKSYIFQLIQSIKSEGEVYALLCPGLHEQFQGGNASAESEFEEQASISRTPCGAASVTDAEGNVSDYVDLWTANAATKPGDTIVLLEDVVLEEDEVFSLEGKTLDLAGKTLVVKGQGIALKNASVKNGNIRFAIGETELDIPAEVAASAVKPAEAGTIFFDRDSITEAFRLLGFADAYELKEVGDGLLADCQYDMWRSTQTKAHRICEISNLPAINKEIRLAVAALKQENPDCKIALISACTRSKLVFEREKGLHVDYVLDFEELMGMMEARGVNNEAITLKVGDKDKEELKIIE